MRQNHFVPLCLTLLALTACGPAAMTDAGVDAPAGDAPIANDVPRPDTPPAPPVCSMVRTVNLTAGMQMVTGNTAGRGDDLALTCGMAPSPQEVVELVLPGAPTTMQGMIFSLVNDGTAIDDTVIEFRSSCMSDVDAQCFDDTTNMEYRSSGRLILPGGTRVFAVISGYDAANAGAWQLDIEMVENPAVPTLTSATALMIDAEQFRATLMAGDADGDADGVIVEFLDAAGVVQGADVDADATTPDVTEFFLGFRTDVAMMTTFTSDVRFTTLAMNPLSMFPTLTGATQARLRVFDAFDQRSMPLTVPMPAATLVARGEACDATNICPDGLECTGAVCVIPPAVLTACGTAAPVTLTAPTGTMSTSVVVDGSIPVGDGVLIAPCSRLTPGMELFYTVAVPAGMHDLVVSTAGTRTAGADTVLYAMSTCGDTSTEPDTSCHDDVDFPMDPSSIIEIQNAGGNTYTVALELYLEAPLAAPVPVGTTFALRPVLATGAMCDVMGVENRCTGGACTAAGTCP